MNNAPVWDSELIQRYNLAGPRYTSYPTAVQFTDQFDHGSYLDCASQSVAATRSLSLYFHIPFCSHICYYCACNKIVTKDKSKSGRYLQSLFREIEMQGELFSSQQPVEQLHLGGGTPTFLDPGQIQALMTKVGQHFNLSSAASADFSIELDPRVVDWPVMCVLRDLGFNRISIGVQDLDKKVQKAVNRVQPLSMIQSVLDASHTMAFNSVHMDLIYGLPLQTLPSFMNTIDRVIDMAPDRLSLFNYAHLPHRFMPQRRINESDLPAPEVKLEILQQATERLIDQGYVYIGMDHFALPDDELAVAQETGLLHRNFQGYTTHSHCDLIGMGVSSISKIGNVYSQNTTNLQEYQASIENNQFAFSRGLVMSEDDQIRQAVINQLICHFNLDPKVIEQKFDIQFADYFARELDSLYPLSRDGLVKINSDHSIEVLPQGKLLIRNICMKFDAYLKKPAEKPLYSRVI